MKTRLIVLLVALAAVIALRWWLSSLSSETPPTTGAPSRASGATTQEPAPSASSSSPPSSLSSPTSASGAPNSAAAAVSSAERSHLADDLNSPTGAIGNDVRILDEIFDHWTTNFPRAGNPVGTNAEITAALTGKNKLALALIPPDHAAINADGELVDRWGTPFRFHQWSGSVTEVISAGPDKKFATADDVSSQGRAEP